MVEERAILTHREVEDIEAVYALRLEADYRSRLVSSQEVQDILDAAHRFLAKVEEVISHET
jgi:uncharacterized protein (UPF0332 family)